MADYGNDTNKATEEVFKEVNKLSKKAAEGASKTLEQFQWTAPSKKTGKYHDVDQSDSHGKSRSRNNSNPNGEDRSATSGNASQDQPKKGGAAYSTETAVSDEISGKWGTKSAKESTVHSEKVSTTKSTTKNSSSKNINSPRNRNASDGGRSYQSRKGGGGRGRSNKQPAQQYAKPSSPQAEVYQAKKVGEQNKAAAKETRQTWQSQQQFTGGGFRSTKSDGAAPTDSSTYQNKGWEKATDKPTDKGAEKFTAKESKSDIGQISMSGQSEKISYDPGQYNHFRVDNTEMGEAVVDAARAQVKETDAERGARQIRRYSDLLNGGGIMRSTSKAMVKDSVYLGGTHTGHTWQDKLGDGIVGRTVRSGNEVSHADVAAILQKEKINGYRMGKDHTMNAVSDYWSSKKALEQYLTAHGVNPNGLTEGRIKRAMATGQLGVFKGNAIKLADNKDVETVLREYRRILKQEDHVRRATGNGGIANTVKAWTREATDETDAARGYQTAKTAVDTAKTTATVGKTVVGETANAGLTIANNIKDTGLIAGRARAKAGELGAKLRGDTKAVEKWKSFDRTMAEKRAISKGKLASVKGKIRVVERNSVPKLAASKVTQAVSGRLAKTKVGAVVLKTREALRKLSVKLTPVRKITKIIRLPFTGLRIAQAWVKKFVIILAAMVFIIIIFLGLSLGVLTMFTADSADWTREDESGDDEIEQEYEVGIYSTAQQAVDDCFVKQRAYETNIWKCEKGQVYYEIRDANGEKTNPITYSDYPIPITWPPQMDYWMWQVDMAGRGYNKGNVVYEDLIYVWGDDGRLIGYYLPKYWGPEDFPYESMVEIIIGAVYDEDGNPIRPITKWVPMICVGTGGLYGSLGDFSGHDDEDPILLWVSEDPIANQSEAFLRPYNEPDYENPHIKVNYHYHGTIHTYDFDDTPNSFYTTTEGDDSNPEDHIDYDVEVMYKALISMGVAMTMNDSESTEFFLKYIRPLFAGVMGDVEVEDGDKLPVEITVTTKFRTNPSKRLKWSYTSSGYGFTIVTLCEVPAQDAYVTVDVDYREVGLQDQLRHDPSDNDWAHSNGSIAAYRVNNPAHRDYHEWEGWWIDPPKNELWLQDLFGIANASEPQGIAIDYFELDDDDMEDMFNGLVFPPVMKDPLSTAEIEDGVAQSMAYGETHGSTVYPESRIPAGFYTNRGTGTREDLVRYALTAVGKFYYKYGAGHPIRDLTNPPKGMDCSAFVSYALYMSGADKEYHSRSAASIISSYPSVPWSHDFSDLKPGTLLVKNKMQGTATTSSNHVVIYLGYLQLEGDEEPRPYICECTTATNADGQAVSGTQLAIPKRVEYMRRTYNYAIDPFYGMD